MGLIPGLHTTPSGTPTVRAQAVSSPVEAIPSWRIPTTQNDGKGGSGKEGTTGKQQILAVPSHWVKSFWGSGGENSSWAGSCDFTDEKLRIMHTQMDTNITHAGFIHYLHLCWARERGCVLRPDILWNTILSEFATSVLDRPEYYRHLFRDRPGKGAVIMVVGSPEQEPDMGVLVDGIRKQISNPAFLSTICDTRFASEAPNAHLMSLMTFACMATPFFDYMTTMCGIPSVDVIGAMEDWVALRKKVQELAAYVPTVPSDPSVKPKHSWDTITPERAAELAVAQSKWLSRCAHLIDLIIHFTYDVQLSSGTTAPYKTRGDFFASIFQYHNNPGCGSGHRPRVVDGWAADFYKKGTEADLEEYSAHVSYVPWQNVETKRMFVKMGSLACSIERADGVLEPRYGFVTGEVLDAAAFKRIAKQ